MKKILILIPFLFTGCVLDFDLPKDEYLSGTWEMTEYGSEACTKDPVTNEWNCSSLVFPGPHPSVPGCELVVEGMMSFEDNVQGMFTWDVTTGMTCSGMGSPNIAWGNFYWDMDNNQVELISHEGYMMGTFKVKRKGDTLTLERIEETATTRSHVWLTFNLSECSGPKLGTCYSNAGCEGHLGGCYSKSQCEYALNDLGRAGSWMGENNICVDVP